MLAPGDRLGPYEITAVNRRVPEGFVAFVEELPGANA